MNPMTYLKRKFLGVEPDDSDESSSPNTSSVNVGHTPRRHRWDKADMTREQVLQKFRDKGVDAFFEMKGGSGGYRNDVTVRTLPSFYGVADALDDNKHTEVLYNGRHTGPGPSTARMYKMAGFERIDSFFLSDYNAPEVRVAIRRQSSSAGPSSYRSFSVEERAGKPRPEGRLYYISCNRSAGTPGHAIFAHDTRSPHETIDSYRKLRKFEDTYGGLR